MADAESGDEYFEGVAQGVEGEDMKRISSLGHNTAQSKDSPIIITARISRAMVGQ